MIVLLTDFGHSEYVGVMKAVIFNLYKTGNIVDLCHNISPQNLIEASWILSNNYHYFPEGAVFCGVVDPGVGTRRRAIAVRTEKYYFVGPDNGLFWETLKKQSIKAIRILNIPEDASQTFHGRDVFAIAAANIAMGRYETVGVETRQDMEKLELFRNENEGIIVRVDTFGNIITNIPGLPLRLSTRIEAAGQNKDSYLVKIGPRRIELKFYSSYALAQENQLFLIEGSNNTLEISLKNANAHKILPVHIGQRVIIS
jgi:S-adenosylmethionine hydrolase